MYSVSISLGASKAYVAVSPIGQSVAAKVVADSSGHRGTAVALAFSDSELLFGDNAVQCYARQPQKVVPYLFALAAACAATQSGENADDASVLMRVVEKASRIKFKGHCGISAPEDVEMSQGAFGFTYDGENSAESFLSITDAFIKFLNYVKDHVVDSACGLSASSEDERKIILTLVAPRYAFPGAAATSPTSGASPTAWLREAAAKSNLGSVASAIEVVLSDEAALYALDSAPRGAGLPYFLNPPPGVTDASPVEHARVLVADWGCHALSFTVLEVRGGQLVSAAKGGRNPPFMCSSLSPASDNSSYFSTFSCCGGDCVDVAMADRVAGAFVLQQRRLFVGRNTSVLMRPNNDLRRVGNTEEGAKALLADCIPARSMRRLHLLMEEKKAALNASVGAVSVEVEAFYEGVDLNDNQTINKNKFEAAVRMEWKLIEMFEQALNQFITTNAEVLGDLPMTHVVLTGGMLQSASVLQWTRQLFSAPPANLQRWLEPSLQVIDLSEVGNGLAACELAAVGGAVAGHFFATVLDRHNAAESRAAKKKKGAAQRSRLIQETTAEGAKASKMVRDLVSSCGDDASSSRASATNNASVLSTTLYLYTGAQLNFDCNQVSRCDIAPLFLEGAALPQRMIVRWPSTSAKSDLALCLLRELGGKAAPEQELLAMTSLTPAAIRIKHPDESNENLFLYFTLVAAPTGEMKLHVGTVLGARGSPPPVLTPANTLQTEELCL